MITGVHAILFTRDPDGVRRFFSDVLGLPSVEAAPGWPIFALPPAELAGHRAEDDCRHELYLMCDDIETTVEEFRGKGVKFTTEITDAGWGLPTPQAAGRRRAEGLPAEASKPALISRMSCDTRHRTIAAPLNPRARPARRRLPLWTMSDCVRLHRSASPRCAGSRQREARLGSVAGYRSPQWRLSTTCGGSR